MSVEVQSPSKPAQSTRTPHFTNTTHSCPSCGTPVTVVVGEVEEAKRTIEGLEAQVKMLREKTAAAGAYTTLWKNSNDCCN